MANHKSAAKRARQNDKRRLRNKAATSVVKTKVREVLAAIGTKPAEEVKATLEDAVRAISKAGSSGILHKKNAARKISRLTRRAAGTVK